MQFYRLFLVQFHLFVRFYYENESQLYMDILYVYNGCSRKNGHFLFQTYLSEFLR